MTGPLTVRTTEIADPGRLADLVTDRDTVLFSQHGDGLVAFGPHLRIAVPGPDRFAQAESRVRRMFADAAVDDEVQLPGTGPVVFGAFTFDPAVTGSVLLLPRRIIGRDRGRAWRTDITGVLPDASAGGPVGAGRTASAHGAPAPTAQDADAGASDGRVRYQGSTMSELAWLAAVDRAVDSLRAGHAEKVVLARDRRVWSRRPFDIGRLVRHLAARFPSCQTFSIDGLVGASPEVLVRRHGAQVTSLVLAGTAPRDPDPAADDARAAALERSAKDVREHVIAVESVRRALEPVTVDLTVEATPHVLRLANVMHLATGVAAKVEPSSSALGLAGVLHPSAAVCGTPTPAARQLIRRLEGMDRARYSGPVGWVDARGDGQWAIALRCAELDETRGRLFAGAGIVEGSLPEAELEETRLKLRAMQSAFAA